MDSIGSFYIKNNILIKYGGEESTVIIPESVKIIGENAFAENRFIESVVMSGICEIGNGAFQYCRNLKKVTLPEGLRKIGANAFAWCKNLKRIVIPVSVTEIGESAFEGLIALNKSDRLLILCETCKPFLRLPRGWSRNWLGQKSKNRVCVVWDCKI